MLNNFLFCTRCCAPANGSGPAAWHILVNQKLKGMNIFRTVYFSPVVTTMVGGGDHLDISIQPGRGTDQRIYPNDHFRLIGTLRLAQDTKLVFPAIMLLSIWQGVGFQMVIYLAGLQEIPDSLYEAAEVDGANKFQQFSYITLPQLRNTTIFVVLSTTILAFKLFDSGPGDDQGRSSERIDDHDGSCR